jgi:hypothetical protein
MSTPVFSDMVCLGCMCGTEKVSQLLNHSVMILFDTRVRGTSTEMVSHRVIDDRDLGAHGHAKESLPETRRPGFISTVRPDLSQSTTLVSELIWT